MKELYPILQRIYQDCVLVFSICYCTIVKIKALMWPHYLTRFVYLQ